MYMCRRSHYIFLADTKDLWQFGMAQKTLQRIVVAQGDPPPIVRIHSISSLQDGSIAFTDQNSRQLKIQQSEGTLKVTAGTGEESNKNGSSSHSPLAK